MYCTNCGEERAADALACAHCGTPAPYFPPVAAIPNYVVQAALVTLFCCMPFGIVALVYSAQVNSKLAKGDDVGAKLSSDRARKWVIVTFSAGILSAGVGIALMMLQ